MNTNRQGVPHEKHRQDYRRDAQSQAGQRVVQVNFFRNKAQKELDPDLLDSKAQQQAGLLHERVNSAQIMKFFGDIKGLYLRLEQGRPWNQIEPMFRMIKSKAAYAASSGRAGRIPEEFRDFLVVNIDKVRDEDDLRAFVLYFEAVLGFMYGKGLVTK
ncbi:MAG: type III-A CRISPR-associated protein Csm2 [Sedimentisphaerales bacterium]|jgi:CRISPR type III-A-associated protein Csm2|nr:type III-A CRISPR-associated protein Csm2 [Sedimentisphaerales bacterium]